MYMKRRKTDGDQTEESSKQALKSFVSERFHEDYDFYFDSEDDTAVFKDLQEEPCGSLSYGKLRYEIDKNHPRVPEKENTRGLKKRGCCSDNSSTGWFFINSHETRLSELY